MPDNVIEGLSQEQINEMKVKFGEVYMINLSGEKYVYRPLKRFEYKTLMSNAEANRAFNEEKIVQSCVVFPIIDAVKMPTLKAGTVSTLVELIMAASNFGVTEEPVRL